MKPTVFSTRQLNIKDLKLKGIVEQIDVNSLPKIVEVIEYYKGLNVQNAINSRDDTEKLRALAGVSALDEVAIMIRGII